MTRIDGESLYAAVVRLGIEHDHHESDLYLPATAQVRGLLKAYGIDPFSTQASQFRNQVTGTIWFDVAFMYAPFWERRQGVHVCPDGQSCTDPRCQQIRRGLGGLAK